MSYTNDMDFEILQTKAGEYLATREAHSQLSDEEFIRLSGAHMIFDRLLPMFQDSLGLNGEQAQLEMFPLTERIASLSDTIISDLIELQQETTEK